MKSKSRLLSGSSVSCIASLPQPPKVKPIPEGMVTTQLTTPEPRRVLETPACVRPAGE